MTIKSDFAHELKIGTPVLMGGSIGRIVGTGTVFRKGVATPSVIVKCPDYSAAAFVCTGKLDSIVPLSAIYDPVEVAALVAREGV